jgi:hypothetical protein
MKLWIARDLDGTLCLFDGNKPKPILGEWMPNKNCYNIDRRLFPEVTYDNSPQEVELKLINKL